MSFSMADISSAIQSLTVVKRVLEAHHALKNFNEIQTALADLHLKLMQFEVAYRELSDREIIQSKLVGELQEKIKHMEDWDSERENYGLVTFAGGVSAYRLKVG